jgi:hypothetical protein
MSGDRARWPEPRDGFDTADLKDAKALLDELSRRGERM